MKSAIFLTIFVMATPLAFSRGRTSSRTYTSSSRSTHYPTTANLREQMWMDKYFDFGIGTVIPGGDAYSGLDARFGMQFEGGTRLIALPITLSFGDDVLIFNMRPRVQYFFNPFRELPALYIGPGVGPSFTYWNLDKSVFGISASADTIALGIDLALSVRYQVTDHWNVAMSPFDMDMQFWRYISPNSTLKAAGSKSGSDTSFGLLYNLMFMAGYTW